MDPFLMVEDLNVASIKRFVLGSQTELEWINSALKMNSEILMSINTNAKLKNFIFNF